MTFEEAKKILEKKGFYLEKATRPCAISEAFTEYENPTICEAMQVVSSAGYFVCMEKSCFDERKARLKEQLEEHSNAPTSGFPALKEAASQFNDALLDEQGKKIKHLTKKITRLNKIIHKKNMKIEEFRKESSRHLRGKIKMFGENLDLEQELKDKVVALAGVAEGLRLSKIREKNLTEVCQKYIKENEKLKKKLADKIVDEIDARALKSAESALAYKEKVIAEKDEVIADLGKELAAMKQQLDSNAKIIQKMAEVIVCKKPVTVDFIDKCWILAYSEEKEAADELSKVLDDVIDQFLLFGEIIIKEEK